MAVAEDPERTRGLKDNIGQPTLIYLLLQTRCHAKPLPHITPFPLQNRVAAVPRPCAKAPQGVAEFSQRHRKIF